MIWQSCESAPVAQGIEQRFPVPRVGGSNPSGCVSWYVVRKEKGRDCMNFARNKLLFFVLGILSIILVILLVQTGKELYGGETQPSPTAQASETPAPTEDAQALKVNAYPKVNALIEKYYSASVTASLDALREIIRPFTSQDETVAGRKSEFVENFQNISCYTVDGVDEGSYIVYAYYEIKFPDVDTLTPGLETLIVSTDESGTEYINNDVESLSEQMQSQISELSQREDVMKLFQDTDAKFLAAIQADESVKSLCEQLGLDVNAMLAETGTDTPASSAEPTAGAAESAAPQGTLTAPEAPSTAVGPVNQELVAMVYAKVRSAPSHDASEIDIIAVGNSVTVLENVDGGFSKVQLDTGAEGYVNSVELAAAATVDSEVTGTATYFSSCSDGAAELGQLSEGTKYFCTFVYSSGWSQLIVDGERVYVRTAQISQ